MHIEIAVQLSAVRIPADRHLEVLSRLQVAQRTIGDVPVFSMVADRTRCYTRHMVRKLWDALASSAGLPKGERYGWHSFRRKFATELKPIPLKDLCHLGGWKSPATTLACYPAPDEATQRTALARRKTLRAVGLGD